MKKLLISLVISLLIIGCYIKEVPYKLYEIVEPIEMHTIKWKEVFSLNKLHPNYIAQGIEVYNNYLFFTIHEEDKKSVLIVFNIEENGNLTHRFSTDFPAIATHVSDLSIYKDILYAIDYASNNLYQIDMQNTIKKKELVISNTFQTHLPRSGSIIVNKYNHNQTLLISQFILNKNISAYNFQNLTDKDKKPSLKISAKYYIQGLYEKDGRVYVSSNKYGIDPIFIINKKEMLKNKNIDLPSTVIINSPGKMVEDLVIYNDYIFTSDEETNKIYISEKTIQEILKEAHK